MRIAILGMYLDVVRRKTVACCIQWNNSTFRSGPLVGRPFQYIEHRRDLQDKRASLPVAQSVDQSRPPIFHTAQTCLSELFVCIVPPQVAITPRT